MAKLTLSKANGKDRLEIQGQDKREVISKLRAWLDLCNGENGAVSSEAIGLSTYCVLPVMIGKDKHGWKLIDPGGYVPCKDWAHVREKFIEEAYRYIDEHEELLARLRAAGRGR